MSSHNLTFYTPGHNIYTDTLIMHGLVRVLAELGCTRGEVSLSGGVYRVGVTCSLSCSELRSGAPHTASLMLVAIQLQLLNKIRDKKIKYRLGAMYIEKLRRFDSFCPGHSYIKALLDSLARGSIADELDPCLWEGIKGISHRITAGEGRGSRGGKNRHLTTLYLPLCPVCGKYSTLGTLGGSGVDAYKENTQYNVCIGCFTYALIGFLYASALLEPSVRDKNVAYVLTAAPRRASLMDILLLQRAFGDPGATLNPVTGMTDLPHTAATMLFTSIVDIPLRRGVDAQLLAWRLERRNTQQAAFAYPPLPFGRLLRAMAALRYHVPEWPRLAKKALTSNELAGYMVEALDYLYQGIVQGSVERIYDAARVLASMNARARGGGQLLPPVPGEALVDALRAAEEA